MPNPAPRPRPLELARLLVLAACVCLGRAAPANATQPPAAPPSPVGSIQQYWDLPYVERQLGLPYSFEGDITYHDPAWGHFWLQDPTKGAYFQSGAGSPAIRAGRHIRLSGQLPPGSKLTDTGATAIDLGPAQIAPLPLPAEGWYEQPEPYNNVLVELEAFVDRQVLDDPEHLHLFLSAAGRPVFAWMLLPPGEPEPQLEQTTVRLRGVFTTVHTTDGRVGAIELKIQHPGAATLLHRLDDDPRFALPVSTLSSLRQRPRDALVHVIGTVRSQQPGSTLTLRDDTAQIEVLSGQSLPCRIGDLVEAVGYPEINGTEWQLRAALYRPYHPKTGGESPEPTAGLPILRVASRILELTAEESARHYPVSLSGTVTWSHPEAPFLFIQDSSGGLCVELGDGAARNYQPGRSILVRGVTTMGPFAPSVIAETIQRTGDMPLPCAETVSLEHALTGRAEAQWIELRGLVRQIHREPPWNRLELTTAAGDFFALLPAAEELPAVTGAVVRVRGVCAADTDEQRRIRGVRLWLRSPEDIQIEEAAPADLFALPAQSLAELGRFGAPQSSDRRVRLSGVVLAQSPGRWVQIQDGDVSLRILTRDPAPLRPGQRLDAVGYLNRRGGRMVLREAAYRIDGDGGQPQPLPFSGAAGEAFALDGRLVAAEGTLLNVADQGDETRLTIEAAAGLFSIFSEKPLAGGVPLQSRIAVTGLMEVVHDEQGQPAGFRVRPRIPADLVVLATPSWLTPRRVLGVAAALALGVGLSLLWVAALRRRVQQQTDQLREQMQRETRLEAELQRATRLESIGLLAGGIAHDFNNLLTVVIGNLSLATLGPSIDRETRQQVLAASRATLRARDLTQQLLTFAKGGSPVRTALALPDLIREIAEFVLRGTAVDCRFDFAPDLWPAHVDKGQISQVVQNIIINAVQAMPDGGHLRIALANEEIAAGQSRLLAPGRYLRLSLADTGKGIAPEVLPRIFDPYFTTKPTGTGIGLATVYSIVRKHGGHITVDSTVGTGTTFHLRLPASSPTATAPTAVLTPDSGSLSGRILLMDDEPEIRALATQMMQHLGLEAHCVADGAAAAEEYGRALRDGRPYDLVILDLTVPGGMGGLQAFRRLREIDAGVRAVVSSGYSEDEVLATYRDHGFVAMVPKPYGIEQLARALRPLLREPDPAR